MMNIYIIMLVQSYNKNNIFYSYIFTQDEADGNKNTFTKWKYHGILVHRWWNLHTLIFFFFFFFFWGGGGGWGHRQYSWYPHGLFQRYMYICENLVSWCPIWTTLNQVLNRWDNEIHRRQKHGMHGHNHLQHKTYRAQERHNFMMLKELGYSCSSEKFWYRWANKHLHLMYMYTCGSEGSAAKFVQGLYILGDVLFLLKCSVPIHVYTPDHNQNLMQNLETWGYEKVIINETTRQF